MKFLHRILGSPNQFVPQDVEWIRKYYVPKIDAALSQRDFKKVAPARWVNSTTAPFRQVVVLEALKGAQEKLLWGLSFDFCPVPKPDGQGIRWARTEKSAIPMLFYDVVANKKTYQDWLLCAFDSVDKNDRTLKRSLEAADDWFKKNQNIDNVLNEFDAWEKRPIITYGYSVYWRAPLVRAFCFAFAGKFADGGEQLAKWCNEQGVPPELMVRLNELLSDAAKLGNRPR